MKDMPIRRKNRFRWREMTTWQKEAIGVLAFSTAANIALYARIVSLDKAVEASSARYQAQIESAERTRDLAVRELGAASLRQAKEQADRVAQAAAYEAVGAYRYVGECTVTYYCPCEKCCGQWADGLTATGLPAGPGVVAVDPEVIPLGATVIIDGQRYLAADTGVTGKHVDVCLPDHEDTVAHGVRIAKVWVVEP